MEFSEVVSKGIRPALGLLPPAMTSDEAILMLLAIGQQESAFKYRQQMGGGPARGFYEFEKGGVRGVLQHPSSKPYAIEIARDFDLAPDVQAVYDELPTNDVLAAAFARLLLWTDGHGLPLLGAEQAAYDLYIRTWRPGKPSRERWGVSYRKALGFMG